MKGTEKYFAGEEFCAVHVMGLVSVVRVYSVEMPQIYTDRGISQ